MTVSPRIPTPLARITLIGAGPGDPDLITRRGLARLRMAKVVLYDALVHPDLLEEVPAGIPKIYVGKRAGKHSFTQERINTLLVESARQFGHAVRLKGGDPFIFGRGWEEKEYAERRGLPVEVVPGLSSSTALPALGGVPLTHRGASRGFWVLTARGSNGELPADLERAAHSDSTVVILMGLGRLGRILEFFRGAGKADLPVMIIQNGSMPGEKHWRGTVADIEESFQRERGDGPGIIILGETVGLEPQRTRARAEALLLR